MTRRSETLIDRSIQPALRKVARGQPYFLREQVLREVLQRHGLAEAIIDVRRSHRSLGLDEAVLSYINGSISRALRSRDDRGVRVYECYSVGPGQKRWKKFRSMTALDVARVLDEYRALKERIEEKIGLYELALDRMNARGGLTIDDVYDDVVNALQMGTDAERSRLTA